MSEKARLLKFVLTSLLLGVCNTAFSQPKNQSNDRPKAELPTQALSILEAHCSKCHGATPTAGFAFRNREAMVSKVQVKPGDPVHSRLFVRAALDQTDPMPPVSEKNPLSKAEIATLQQWILAGAQFPANRDGSIRNLKRNNLNEDYVLNAITKDIEQSNERDRPYLRYFILTNLINEGASEEQAETYRTGLARLINSLSWQRRVSIPVPIDPVKSILRIDMRKYSWIDQTWTKLLRNYPYGVVSRSPTAESIRVATKCTLPYVRVDWFVANGTIPPLYNSLIDLPDTAAKLEQRLLIDIGKDFTDETLVRAGFTESGVSRNNRIVERHESPHGAYWRSFDFSSNTKKQNIFTFPLNFEPAGGEIIFNLPNGLQGYMLVNGNGSRVDEGPIEIVNNKNNAADPVVRNGLTCMTCHTRGLKIFSDQMRAILEKTNKNSVDFDYDKALALYAPSAKMNDLISEDIKRFATAVQSTGAEIMGTEPLVQLSTSFQAPLNLEQAAAEVGVPSAALADGIRTKQRLQAIIGVLGTQDGLIKRDSWEENFGAIVRELNLGDYLPYDPIVAARLANGAPRNPGATSPFNFDPSKSDLRLPLFEDKPTTCITLPPSQRLVVRIPMQETTPRHYFLLRGSKLEIRGQIAEDETDGVVGIQVGNSQPTTATFTKEWVFTWDSSRETRGSVSLVAFKVQGSTNIRLAEIKVDLVSEELANFTSDTRNEAKDEGIGVSLAARSGTGFEKYQLKLDDAPINFALDASGRAKIKTDQLPPGDHVLCTEAITKDGVVWVSNGLSLHIHSHVRIVPLASSIIDLTHEVKLVPLHLELDRQLPVTGSEFFIDSESVARSNHTPFHERMLDPGGLSAGKHMLSAAITTADGATYKTVPVEIKVVRPVAVLCKLGAWVIGHRSGAKIVKMASTGVLQRTNLGVGDIIYRLNGASIQDAAELLAVSQKLRAGSSVVITYYTPDMSSHTVRVVLPLR